MKDHSSGFGLMFRDKTQHDIFHYYIKNCVYLFDNILETQSIVFSH